MKNTLDLRLDVTLRDQVEAGNHTIYVGIIEDGVDDDEARYFDMPVTVVVKEDVVAGRLLITLESQMTPFGPGQSKNSASAWTTRTTSPDHPHLLG